MTTYNDETHITSRLSVKMVAEAVRHKKYGVDVREAIAQGFESLESREDEVNRIAKLEDQVKKLKEQVTNLEKETGGLNQIEGIKAQIDRLNDAVFGTDSWPVDYSEITRRDEKNGAKELKLPDYVETVEKTQNIKRKELNLNNGNNQY